MSFNQYIRNKKYKIILSIIGFILGSVLYGTFVQPALKKYLFSDNTIAQLDLINSSIAVFQGANSLELFQLFEYELQASDLLKNIKIKSIFKKDTEIINYNVLFSIDIEGYNVNLLNKNQIEIYLSHEINSDRKAKIYLFTKRIVKNREDIKLELPDIHIEGKDKDGNAIYK